MYKLRAFWSLKFHLPFICHDLRDSLFTKEKARNSMKENLTGHVPMSGIFLDYPQPNFRNDRNKFLRTLFPENSVRPWSLIQSTRWIWDLTTMAAPILNVQFPTLGIIYFLTHRSKENVFVTRLDLFHFYADYVCQATAFAMYLKECPLTYRIVPRFWKESICNLILLSGFVVYITTSGEFLLIVRAFRL